MQALQGTPISGGGARDPGLLASYARISRGGTPTNVTHYNVAPTVDVLASVEGTDLGSVASRIEAIVAEIKPTLPRGSTIVVRGQVESMSSSFRGLGYGLIFAIGLVCLLMVVSSQSWLDPLIILMALPGALSGIVWMLFVTGTTLSVPSLMGAIMSIGVATANSLVTQGLSSQHDLDLKKSAFDTGTNGIRSADATIRSRQATVKRLGEQMVFARVTAPFAGTVTSRSVEVGALVTAGNGAGQAMFKIADVGTLRVFVSVPQTYAPLMRVGEDAQVSVREYPGRSFPGQITRATGALDPATRSMQTEIEVPNGDHALLPGMYAQASLHLAASHPPLLVPASALVLGAEGTAVLVVGADQRVRRKKIVIEGDYGADLGIAEGVLPDDRVISNPSERLAESLEVEVVSAPPAGSGAPAASAAAGAGKK